MDEKKTKETMLSMIEEDMERASLQPLPSSLIPMKCNKTTAEEWIALFNQAVDDLLEMEKNMTFAATTVNYTRKQASINTPGSSIPLSSLRLISLIELEVGKTHRGCVVYCKIVTRALHLASVNVLVQDESNITDLALYGNVDSKELKVGRTIAIKEPFYKTRNDGSEGIRIDNPASDLVFDPKELSKADTKPPKADNHYKRATVEDRIKQFVEEDEAKAAEKVYRQLIDEGYDITKKRVRALKKTVLQSKADKNEESSSKADIRETKNPIVSIISERCPKKHRVLKVQAVFKSKEAGNQAFLKKRFEEADTLYSKSLKHKNDPPEESADVVELWQIYCNRSAARMKMGHLHEALQDGLMANICASAGSIKPLLRCAEALVALGLHNDATNLLESTADSFPGNRETIEKKKILILPKKTLRVGKNSEFSTITEAIQHAPAGSEILVEAGVYRENLFITKPITLRCNNVHDFEALQSLEGNIKTNTWAEICSVGDMASIICRAKKEMPIHIIGFKISCEASPTESYHAVGVSRGMTVLRNCILSSTSGPVVCAQCPGTNLLMQACAVHRGAQGGILCSGGARLSLHQIHCCNNAAAGLELRSGGSANLEGCHFYSNGSQGICSWQGAGKLKATNCEIHSQQMESGVLVSEAEVILQSCKIYGNGIAGVVSQLKGNLLAIECEVHNNLDGIQIQDTGCAKVEQCKVYSNRSHGIFVGYDHRGSAALIDNHAFNNRTKGIFVPNSRNVVVRKNTEYGNLFLPPELPAGIFHSARRRGPSDKYVQRVKKNTASAKKAPNNSTSHSFMDSILKQAGANKLLDEVLGGYETYYRRCSFCHLEPQEDEHFSKCSRCKSTPYCSPKCQKSDWSNHKKSCHDAAIKYPTFLDPTKSI